MVTIYLAPGSSISRRCHRSTPRKTSRRTMLPSGSSGQPGDEPDTRVPSIRPCSRWGLAAAASPQRPGALTARLQPYRRISQRRRICGAAAMTEAPGGGMFLCHFPSPAAARKPPPKPGRYPAPCPVEPGLSSPARIAPHRGGHPVCPASPTLNLAQAYRWVKLRMNRYPASNNKGRVGYPPLTVSPRLAWLLSYPGSSIRPQLLHSTVWRPERTRCKCWVGRDIRQAKHKPRITRDTACPPLLFRNPS